MFPNDFNSKQYKKERYILFIINASLIILGVIHLSTNKAQFVGDKYLALCYYYSFFCFLIAFHAITTLLILKERIYK
jgi:hypothetical protein